MAPKNKDIQDELRDIFPELATWPEPEEPELPAGYFDRLEQEAGKDHRQKDSHTDG